MGSFRRIFLGAGTMLAMLALPVFVACGGGHSSPPPPVAPSITTQPANQTALEGDTPTFSVVASGTDPLTYQWSKGGTALSGATNASYTSPAVAIGDSGSTFTVTITNSAGSVTSNPATLTVYTRPAIASFQAAPATITVGGTATLSFGFSGGAGSIDNNVGSVTSGTNVDVKPSATTTYTLTVDNGHGTTKTSTATVTVAPVPVAPVISVASTVTAGKTGLAAAVTTPQAGIVYSWAATNATLTSAVTGNSVTFTAGSVGSASLTCTATNAANATASSTANLTVVAAPTASITASTANPLYGATNVTVTPTFTNATSAKVGTTQGGGDVSATASTGTPISVQASGFTTAATYYLTATNAAGDSASASIAVAPQSIAVSSLSGPANLTVGTSGSYATTVNGAVDATVSWYVDNIAGGNATVGTITSGGAYSAPATAGTHVIKAVANADHTTASAPFNVNVVPAPDANITPVATTVSTGKTGLTASVPSQGSGTTYAWTMSGGAFTSATNSSSVTFTAGSVGTLSLNCTVTNAASAATTGSVTLTVVALPTANLAASNTNPLYGATNVTVTPTFTNATSAKVGTTQGGSNVSASATSGTPIAVQASGFVTTTTYWVRATNAAGDFVDASVQVTPQTVGIGVTPATKNVTVNDSVTFTATVINAVDTSVTWTASAGSITTAGVWTAPATAGTCTVTATSVADPTHAATATVSVYAAPNPAITATPTTVAVGATNLTASVQTQTGATYAWSLTNGTGTGQITSATTGASITYSALTAGTFTLNVTVTNGAGVSASSTASIQAVVEPYINLFSATPTSVLSGGAVTLSYTFGGGSGVVSASDASVSSSVTSGGTLTVNPTTTPSVTYTLTVTGGVGTTPATQTATVTVGTPLTFTTDLPATGTVLAGQTFTMNVVVSGTPAPTAYDWYHGATKVTSTSTGSYTINNAQVSDGGSWYVVASNGITSKQSATLNLTVNAGYMISGQITVANGSMAVPGATVTLGGASSGTTTTDSSGNFAFSGLANGTYTVTPSISTSGVSSWFLPITQSVTLSGSNATANFQADIGFSVSGTVTYSGSKTGRIYLALDGNGPVNGVSLSAAGTFTIRGVPPGNYTLYAYLDTVGLGNANANNPGPSATIPVSVGSAPVAGVTVNLVDPTAPTLSSAPTFKGLVPYSKGVLVNYAPLMSGTNLELPTSYDVQWSTSSSFATIAGTLNFKAQGANNPMCFLSGLSDGTLYYLRIRGNVGAANGPWSSSSTITPNATTGSYTVAGTVSLPAGVTGTGPLAVALVDDVNKRYYITSFASPGASNAYSLAGVVAGSYKLFGILDQNHNGIIDPGDITNTNGNGVAVAVAGNLTGQDLTLSNASATAQLATQHWKQTGASSGEGYNLNFRINGNVKLPVNLTLQLGANGTVDVGVNSNGGDKYQYWLNSLRPLVGDSYPVTVTYSDGTSETLNPAVTAVLDTFAQNLAPTTSGSGVTTPTFTWAAPATPPASYTYDLWVNDSTSGQIWGSWDMPSTQTSILFNADGSASQPTLTLGTTYTWGLGVKDVNGNSAQIQVNYKP